MRLQRVDLLFGAASRATDAIGPALGLQERLANVISGEFPFEVIELLHDRESNTYKDGGVNSHQIASAVGIELARVRIDRR